MGASNTSVQQVTASCRHTLPTGDDDYQVGAAWIVALPEGLALQYVGRARRRSSLTELDDLAQPSFVQLTIQP